MKLLARYLAILCVLATGGFFLGVGLAQVTPGPSILEDHGTVLGVYKKFNCGQGTTCTLSGSVASISAAGGSGSGNVTAVSGTSPINSSGGTNPNLSLITPLSKAFGGTSDSTIANTLVLGGGSGLFAAFGGTTCASGTVIRTLDASGSATTCSALPAAGGTVTGVQASGPITSSGGTNPSIGLVTPLSVQYGGTSLSTITNAIMLGNGTGAPSAFGGSGPCGANSFATSISASGSLSCTTGNVGTVTGVQASGPVTSTGGLNPSIGIVTPLSVQYGGTSSVTQPSAILLGNGTGLFNAYAGSTCTNQAFTALNASGSVSCSTLTQAYMSFAASTVVMGLGTAASAIVMPPCGDVGGQHVNYASGGVFVCGTTGVAGGSGVTSVTASTPLTSSGGNTPNLSLNNNGVTTTYLSGPVNTVFMGQPGGASVPVIPNCPDGGGNHLNYASGTMSWVCGTTSGAAAAAVSTLTAATASNSITWNGNIPQVWAMGTTTDNTKMFSMSESIISSGGTSTGGVPNQVLFNLYTNGGSTMSPLCVSTRTVSVFCVSPTTTQILAANGAVGTPIYSLAGFTNYGIYKGTGVSISHNGTQVFDTLSTGKLGITPGTSTSAGLVDLSNQTTGFSFSLNSGTDGDSVSVVNNTLGEFRRFSTDTVDAFDYMKQGSANATGYTVKVLKSRGTPQAPTVITTGDDLLTVRGHGYKGATNTFGEAARLSMTSNGTIADTTSGIGGIIKFATTRAASDTVVQTNLTIQGGSAGYTTFGPVTFATLPTGIASGSVLFCQDCDAPTLVDSTCTSSGAKVGALAVFINSLWKCIS